MEAWHAVSVVSAQPGEIQGEEDKKQRRWHFLAAASRTDMIMISRPDIYHCGYYYCYLLLMIVYVGIGRASFLINIVRFDLGRATSMRNVFSLGMIAQFVTGASFKR